MMFFVVAILLAFAEAAVITGKPKCVKIRNINYEMETLKNDVTSPYQLSIDHDTNTLFFSYTAQTDEMFKSAYLSLKTGEYGIVPGIHGGFASAVNSKNHSVYLGGEDGIYEFDYKTKSATNLLINNENIWQMFYKNGLYFTTYPEENAYIYKSGKISAVPEVRDHKVIIIAVTNDNNIVYSNSSGMFMYNREKEDTTTLSDAVANGFTTDIEGNLYYSTATGIYYVNQKYSEINELVEIDNIYGLAIESNGNFIYASEDSIIRLKPTKSVCLEDPELNKQVSRLNTKTTRRSMRL